MVGAVEMGGRTVVLVKPAPLVAWEWRLAWGAATTDQRRRRLLLLALALTVPTLAGLAVKALDAGGDDPVAAGGWLGDLWLSQDVPIEGLLANAAHCAAWLLSEGVPVGEAPVQAPVQAPAPPPPPPTEAGGLRLQGLTYAEWVRASRASGGLAEFPIWRAARAAPDLDAWWLENRDRLTALGWSYVPEG